MFGIGLGVWAFIIYITFIIAWSSFLKRSLAEAMGLGLLIAAAFSGTGFFPVLKESLESAFSSNVMLGIMLFNFMTAVINQTGIIKRLVTILNSVLGKVRGGSAYVSALASTFFGLIAGGGTANSATIGAITIPWMKQSGWPSSVAATMNAGNAGMGLALPVSTPLLLILGFPAVSSVLELDDVYFALICGGLWTLLYRMILVTYYVRKYNVPALPNDQILPLGVSLKANGSSLTMFLGCAIPIILTTGPVNDFLSAASSFGEKASNAIDIIQWVPALIALICLIEGRKQLPTSWSAWKEILLKTRKNASRVGAMSFFGLAGSEALTAAGFGDDFQILLQKVALPAFILVIVIGIMIALAAGPLNASATAVALGSISYTALVSAGCDPVNVVVAMMIFLSTEGASPPSSAPIFISCGIAEEKDVSVTFKPLVFHYVIPVIVIGILIAYGILPIIH